MRLEAEPARNQEGLRAGRIGGSGGALCNKRNAPIRYPRGGLKHLGPAQSPPLAGKATELGAPRSGIALPRRSIGCGFLTEFVRDALRPSGGAHLEPQALRIAKLTFVALLIAERAC